MEVRHLVQDLAVISECLKPMGHACRNEHRIAVVLIEHHGAMLQVRGFAGAQVEQYVVNRSAQAADELALREGAIESAYAHRARADPGDAGLDEVARQTLGAKFLDAHKRAKKPRRSA